MALGSVLVLLSLAAALLLVAHHSSSSSWPCGPGAALADLLLDRLHGVSLLDLATRRNMVLLCHAILLVLLGDAGLLSTPARRRQSAGAADGHCDYSPPEPERSPRAKRSAGVVWSGAAVASHTRNAAVGEEDLRAAPASFTEPEHEIEVAEHGAAKEIVVVEGEQEQGTYDLGDRHLVAGAMDGEIITYPTMDLGRASVAHGDETNRTEEETMEEEGEPAADERGEEEEEEEDLDEMNRRFEAFIADTKAKMRLEAMQPSIENSRALLIAH